MSDQFHVAPGLSIPIGELEIRTSRSSGPGGQHANVTASRVEVSLAIASSSALNEEQRMRLRERFGDRVVATAQDTRSQLRNRELALARLRDRIALALAVDAPRRPTRAPRSASRRRVQSKRLRGQLKRGRRSGGDEND